MSGQLRTLASFYLDEYEQISIGLIRSPESGEFLSDKGAGQTGSSVGSNLLL